MSDSTSVGNSAEPLPNKNYTKLTSVQTSASRSELSPSSDCELLSAVLVQLTTVTEVIRQMYRERLSEAHMSKEILQMREEVSRLRAQQQALVSGFEQMQRDHTEQLSLLVERLRQSFPEPGSE